MDTIPKEKAFYFFTSIGNYTGKKTSSLKDFLEVIKDIECKSVEFHLYRRDFQKWFREVLNINELADQIDKLEKQNLRGELLRIQILDCISTHLRNQSSADESEKMDANLLVTFESIYYPEARQEIKQVLREIGEENPQFIHSKVQGLFKLHITDPKEKVKKLDTLCREEPSKFEFTYHWIPVETWCPSTVEEMSKIVEELAKKINKEEKWRMRINKRFYEKLHTQELIEKLTRHIDLPNVDLDNPDKTIRIEIIGNKAAISLLTPKEHLSVNEIKSELFSAENVKSTGMQQC